jgi:hypothetical protein
MALPITILLPTRNSMRFLPSHLKALEPLLPLVDEVVHVDSESLDGTVECAREGIPASKLRYFAHPPGLYQSWNFGISQARSKYVYISTVGDSMQADGLSRLCEVAEKLSADVVVSIPKFESEDGRMVNDIWPVHQMIEELKISEPKIIPKLAAFATAVANWKGGILNSSASNLYRADVLKARPFPLEFGTAGDVGWGVANSLFAKIAILPETFSTFLVHEKTYSLKDYQVPDFRSKIAKLAREAVEEANLLKMDSVASFLQVVDRDDELQTRLETYRRSTVPWIFYPGAWRLRGERKKNKAALTARRDALIAATIRDAHGN